ncbi:MAG: FAD-binding oxidoreductase [Pseudonocardiaceae bacterium]
MATPDCIQLVGSTQDVIEVVTNAVTNGQLISARSGGHCYENFVCNKVVKVIIDVSGLDQISYDDTRKLYCVGAGATNWQICTHLFRLCDRVLPGGSCYSVGAGGHICSGGFGLLSRQFGLTVDYLDAVEVVVVRDGQAEAVFAPRDSANANVRDLWWAHTGGGGGNFGVITKYWFRDLPKPPKHVWLSSAQFNWSDLNKDNNFYRLVDNYGKFFAAHKDPADKYADLFAILKLTHVSNGRVELIVQLNATSQDDKQKLNDFYSELLQVLQGEPPIPLLKRQDQFMPWIQAAQTLNESGPNRRGKYKSAYHRTSFTEDHIQAFCRHLNDLNYTNSEALLQIDSYGCAINKTTSASTAVAQRDSALKLQYQTYWTDPREDDTHLAWIREFYADVYSKTGGVPDLTDKTDGCFIGYPDVDLSNPDWNKSKTPWSGLYYKDNYHRLQQIKTHWDPAKIFHHAQSIEPLPPPGG